jgi:peptidylamidoglycolate lyase
MNRRKFIEQSMLISVGFSLGAKPEPIIGHGEFQYKIDSNWCKADPSQHPVTNCHELVLDKKGRIFMTTDNTKNNILVFNNDGLVVDAWGHEYPGAHGLTLHDENGEEFLYITDYERHEVIKTTLNGRVVQVFGWPEEAGLYANKSEFSPTETAIAPNGDLFVADGYGKDYIVHYGQNGQLKSIFGGPNELKNAHGIALDTRNAGNPGWLITSRADNTLKRYSLEGKLIESIAMPGAFICRPVVKGAEVYFAVLIAELPWDSGTGYVCILDKNNRVISAPGGSMPKYQNEHLQPLYQTIRVFKHPHDVLVDADDNLLVSQWNSGNVYPIKLTRV